MSSAPVVGQSSPVLASELMLDSAGRWVDSDGRRGYVTLWGGAYVCYTCGHLCECGEITANDAGEIIHCGRRVEWSAHDAGDCFGTADCWRWGCVKCGETGAYDCDEYDVCICPCGCWQPLAGDMCTDCSAGTHQNNNNRDEYRA